MLDTLKQLGLTENEAKIYLALSETDGLPTAELAERTGLSRPYLYDALERMHEKQFVSFLRQDGRKVFKAAKPGFLRELAYQKLEKIDGLVQELERRQRESEKLDVELYRGKHVFKVLLKDILSTVEEGEEILIFGIDDEALISMDEYTRMHLQQYFARIERKQIVERVIVRKGAKTLPEATPSRYRFLPEGTIGSTAFEVYADKVAIFFWGEPNHLVLIKGGEVASSYRQQFELLWRVASSR